MVIGNIFLADTIVNQQNDLKVTNPNVVFTALTYPAFLSFDAALTISGVEELGNSFKICVDLLDEEGNYISNIAQGESTLPDVNAKERLTLNMILNLRKVAIQHSGIYELLVKVNDKEITRTKFEAWTADGK